MRDPGAVLRCVFGVCQAFAGLLLVAFILGSLAFTGGRVGEERNPLWGELWGWPVFPVPAWLVIVPAAIASAVVIPMCVRTPARRANLLLGAIGQTAAAIAAAVAFTFVFPADSGVWTHPVSNGYLGPHWIALPLDALCVAVLIVTLVVTGPKYERLRTSGGDVT